jgi:hypothetical protein
MGMPRGYGTRAKDFRAKNRHSNYPPPHQRGQEVRMKFETERLGSLQIDRGSAFVQADRRECAPPENDSRCAPTVRRRAESSDVYTGSRLLSNFEIGSTQGSDLAGKRLALLKEALPGIKRAAILWNRPSRGSAIVFEQMTEAARSLDLQLAVPQQLHQTICMLVCRCD